MTDNPQLTLGFFSVYTERGQMTEFYRAYGEYLERMLQQSDELVLVDEETIPYDCNRAVMEEWASAD